MSRFSPEPGESRRQFEEEVFPAELGYVEDRRRAVGDDREPLPKAPEVSTGNDLVGLALSGGGIRSASFSLGFLQSLPERLFRRIDYLSTVSGGGFIGSSVTALMANAFYRRQGSAGDGEPAEFPFKLTRSEREPPALSHLRNNSNYMAPGGLSDLFRLLAVLLRGIILNSLSLLPFLLLVCLVVLLMYGQQLSDRARFDNQVQQIDALLGRYYGDRLAENRELEPLLEVLEGEALLRIDEGKTRSDVLHQLRPALSFRQGSEADLITGNGSAEAPYRLVPDASREDLARVLLEAGVLQRYAVIEEIDLLARELGKDGVGEPVSVDMLVGAAYKRDLIRPGTDERKLVEFLARHRNPRLKPVLQALYNGEYLDQDTVRGLVEEERSLRRSGRRSPDEEPFFYAYGWYETLGSQAFPNNWYAGHTWPEPRQTAVLRELGQLTEAFADCIATGGLDTACLRPATTPGDVRRLLVFQELLTEPGDFDQLAVGNRLAGAVEALYFGEYLNQEWAVAALRPRLERGVLRRLAEEILVSLGSCAGGTADAEADCLRRLEPMLARETVPGDLLAALREAQSSARVRAALEPMLAAADPGPVLVALDPLLADDPGRTLGALDRIHKALMSLPADDLDPNRLQEAFFSWQQGASDPVLELLAPLMEGEPGPILEEIGRLLAELLPPPKDDPARLLAELGPVAAEDPDRVLEPLEPLLDGRWVHDRLYVYSYGWHRRIAGKAYPGAWCGNAAASLGGVGGCPESSDEEWRELARALRDPSRWDPGHLRLPFTWIAIRAALGWVLLFPLLLLGGRAIYRRRQRAVVQEPNPLTALLSSDQSLDWRDLYERTFGVLLMGVLGIALIELLPYAVHHFHYSNLRGQSSRTLAVGVVSLLVTALGGPALALLERLGRLVALALLAVAGPLLLLTLFVVTMERAVYAPPPQVDQVLGYFAADLELWSMDGGRLLLDPTAAWLLFAITLAASVGLALLIDINGTSLHGLYRDRIAKAFMVGLDTGGDVEPEEDLPLAKICPPGSGAPYHLLNVALNLHGSGDRTLRGRASDFLFFSRDHVGGPRTGFCPTPDLARLFPHGHLASAMAVSAAAVSPNMGRYKSGPLAILMSLLNTRLALWMPHPGAVRKWFAGGSAGRSLGARLLAPWRRLRLRAPATLLLRELAGAVHDRRPVVNVSDGGHIENTGALELLRRRCREIVLVDGEADPDMAFGGLALLQRIARIDMGIEIEIDLDELRCDDEGNCRRRSAVGVIRYPARQRRGAGQELDEEIGRLLYVKLAVTGSEDETVAEYRARHVDFPHQSTGDQAFDEGQLEAYRELGYLAGREVFGAEELDGE